MQTALTEMSKVGPSCAVDTLLTSVFHYLTNLYPLSGTQCFLFSSRSLYILFLPLFLLPLSLYYGVTASLCYCM